MTTGSVLIPADGVTLRGQLTVPTPAQGVVVFAHGSGSSHLSPRNIFVAGELAKRHMATLLFDLLTEEEDQVREERFDIGLLTDRLYQATRWALLLPELAGIPLGFFGASTGTAAALTATTMLDDSVVAIVSRGGRPDLAGSALQHVTAPTLLIVGSLDQPTMEVNQQAFSALASVEKELAVVDAATHLFSEEGTLEQVASLAGNWFATHFRPKG